MKIQTKIWAMIVLPMIVITAVLSLFMYVKSINKAGEEQILEMAADSDIGADSKESLLLMRMNVKDFLLTNEPKEIEEYNKYYSAIQANIKRADEGFQNPKRREHLGYIKEKTDTYNEKFVEVQNVITTRNQHIEAVGPIGKTIRTDLIEVGKSLYAKKKYEEAATTDKAAIHLMLTRYYLLKYTKTHEPSDLKRAKSELNLSTAKLDNMSKELSDDPQSQAKVAEITSLKKEYDGHLDQIGKLVRQRDELVLNNLDVIGPQIMGHWSDIRTSLDQDTQTLVKELAGTSSFLFWLTLIGSLLGAGMILAAGLYIAKTIINPLKSLTDRLRNIAEGEADLSQRVESKGKDELATVGRLFNQFVGRIDETVHNILLSAHEVAGAANQIAATNEQLSQNVSEQNSRTVQIAAAMEEMSATVHEVAGQSGEAARASKDSGDNASSGGQVVQVTIEGMHQVADVVNQSTDIIKELGLKGEKIGNVITVINDIAEQTNLLALNAAIEAARAGDAGRGFAVVADEVRQLAERTAKATKEVSDVVNEIQEDMKESVASMERIKAHTTESMTNAEQAGESLNRIVSGSTQVDQMIQAIASASEEQSSAAMEISQNLQNIQSLSLDSQSAVEQTSQATGSLSQKAEHMLHLMSEFKTTNG